MTTAVIGLGLIGGSLVRALTQPPHRDQAHPHDQTGDHDSTSHAGETAPVVVGYDRDPAVRAMARTDAAQRPPQARWQVVSTISDAVASADLVVLATGLPAVAEVLDEIVGSGFAGVVTDVVSVKQPLRDLVAPRLRGSAQRTDRRRVAGYVGGHPMAGREKAGFAAGDPELFRGCAWVLCLDHETHLGDWLTVARLVTSLGARVVPTTSTDHDRTVAAISHVPHLLAAALATAVADPLAATLAAGSFRDGTRVAASSPELVAAMCGGNAGPVRQALDSVIDSLQAARAALTAADPAAGIRRWVMPANAARAGWPCGRGEPYELPATAEELLRLGGWGGWVTAVAGDGRTVTAVRPV